MGYHTIATIDIKFPGNGLMVVHKDMNNFTGIVFSITFNRFFNEVNETHYIALNNKMTQLQVQEKENLKTKFQITTQ